MKKYYITALLLCCSLPNAQAADLERGQKIFGQTCYFCHGERANKSALNQSRLIVQLSPEEIVSSLKKRKDGEIIGAGNSVKSRLSEEDMRSVAEFIQTLK